MTNNTENLVREISDVDFDTALKLINNNVDKNWDTNVMGSYFIGVTGQHQVYYTFWKHSPKAIMNPTMYIGNLSIDFLEAIKKAKNISGRCPVYIMDTDSLKGMQGVNWDVLTFGKYRRQKIGDVFINDPQYIIWLSKNFTPRNNKQAKAHELMLQLTKDFFDAMRAKNEANDTTEYYGAIKDKLDMTLSIVSVISKYDKLRFRCKIDNSNIEFYIAYNSFAKAMDINFVEKCIRDDYNGHYYGCGNVGEILEFAKNMNTIHFRGRIKAHRAIMGIKQTQLHFVKVVA